LDVAISTSYDLLNPHQQAVFRRLSVFVGEFTLEAAAQVATLPTHTAAHTLPAIIDLVHQNLLSVTEISGQHHYRMLATIRSFAHQHLDAYAEAAAAYEKLCVYLHQCVARQLDVSDPASIERLRAWVASEFGVLDVLVNNAAILYDSWQRAVDSDLAGVQQALDTNTFGPWRMAQAFIPLLRQSKHGRIVNVSSEGGSLASMGGGTPAYSVSKAALNAVTRLLAGELRGDRILVNSICPGWTATDMGGASAPRSPAEGARGIVWAATLPDDGPSGGFFRDGKPLAW
jgi:NAD(P)-dependent dehydrogenase (short-subunit alcohol dehydrogenase family)